MGSMVLKPVSVKNRNEETKIKRTEKVDRCESLHWVSKLSRGCC